MWRLWYVEIMVLKKGHIRLRTLARKTGVLRLISALRRCLGRSGEYEERFGKSMLSQLRDGDVVWDVGANVGLYSDRFLQAVGDSGHVICFEPAPGCYQALREKFGNQANVTLNNVALGARVYNGFIKLNANPLAGVHQLADAQDVVGTSYGEVHVITGDSYVADGGDTPDVMKVDVEGFELDVFQGLGTVLASQKLRAIYCEVHYELLEKRGLEMAPCEIEKILNNCGFVVTWLDASHIEAHRPMHMHEGLS